MEKAIDHHNLYNTEGEADTFKCYVFVFRLKKLIKREPEDAKYYFTLGMLHMDMQDYKEAEKDFKNCIKVSDLKTGSILMTSKLGQVQCFYELCHGQFSQKLNKSQILKRA